MSQVIYHPDAIYTPRGLLLDHALMVDTSTGRILSIDPAPHLLHKHPDLPITRWPHMVLFPGTINTHAHSFQHLVRGIGTDAPFLVWRDHALYDVAPALDPDAVYTGARLAFAEMALSGITTVADFFYVHQNGIETDQAVVQAAHDVGIRLVLARCLYDWSGAPQAYQETVADAVSRTHQLAKMYQADPLVTVHPAPHSLHGASDDMIQAGVALARELQTPYHIHVAEQQFEGLAIHERTGKSPVQHLAQIGAVTANLIAVHLVWIDPTDIELLGQAHASLAYCPSSNMFLADGVTPLPKLLESGVTAGLGTDGGCSNNRSSIFEEMRMASLLQKVSHLNTQVITADKVFQMGTRAGAKMLDLDAGELSPGKLADFVAIDMQHLSCLPWSPDTALANVVYSLQPEAIRHVVVGGVPIVRDRQLSRVSEKSIEESVRAFYERWKSLDLDP